MSVNRYISHDDNDPFDGILCQIEQKLGIDGDVEDRHHRDCDRDSEREMEMMLEMEKAIEIEMAIEAEIGIKIKNETEMAVVMKTAMKIDLKTKNGEIEVNGEGVGHMYVSVCVGARIDMGVRPPARVRAFAYT